jgi:hypothetical protein
MRAILGGFLFDDAGQDQRVFRVRNGTVLSRV